MSAVHKRKKKVLNEDNNAESSDNYVSTGEGSSSSKSTSSDESELDSIGAATESNALSVDNSQSVSCITASEVPSTSFTRGPKGKLTKRQRNPRTVRSKNDYMKSFLSFYPTHDEGYAVVNAFEALNKDEKYIGNGIVHSAILKNIPRETIKNVFGIGSSRFQKCKTATMDKQCGRLGNGSAVTLDEEAFMRDFLTMQIETELGMPNCAHRMMNRFLKEGVSYNDVFNDYGEYVKAKNKMVNDRGVGQIMPSRKNSTFGKRWICGCLFLHKGA